MIGYNGYILLGREGGNIIASSTGGKESLGKRRGGGRRQRRKRGCGIHNTSWLVGQMLETSSRGQALSI